MAKAGTEQIMKSFMNSLYTTLTDGEDEFIPNNERERFITWSLPGIPFEPEDLEFARRGLVGKGNTPEELAESTARQISQASQFARLVDFVPDVTGVFDEKQQLVAFHRNESALSRIYERVLNQSQVAASELTDIEKERMERFRNLLYPEQEVEDLITGEITMQRVEGPIMKAYKAHMSQYFNEFLDYNGARIKALAKVSAEAELFWATTAPTLERKLRNALGEWEVNGRKGDVEKIQAWIKGVTSRSLATWKADVKHRFEASKLSDPFTGEFLVTTLIPGGFAQSDQGWSKFSFTHNEVDKFSKGKSTEFDVDGKLGWGALSVGGSAGGKTEKKHEVSEVTNFEMSFSVAQIPLSRPWFDPTFLESRAWRLAPNALDVSALSDGEIPPKGLMVAYPTSVIFVRDVRVNFEELHDESSELRKELKAGGSVGYGPFKLGGKYSRAQEEKTIKTRIDKKGLTVEGMQIIGFRCHLLEKSPDPEPSIEEWE